MPVELGIDTRRADGGLALSSRNGYLSDAQREQARLLSQTLQKMAQAVKAGATDFAALEAQAMQTMTDADWKPDYMTLRRQSDLQLPQPGETPTALVALGAARLGTTRLIDNLEVT
jgi:pantoate--beta-alanine ligase